MSIKLKPCPFCGGSAFFRVFSHGSANSDASFGFTIKCRECGLELPKRYGVSVEMVQSGEIKFLVDGREQAASAWNKRIPMVTLDNLKTVEAMPLAPDWFKGKDVETVTKND